MGVTTIYVLVGVLFIGILAIVFYDNLWAVVFLWPILLLFRKMGTEQQEVRRRNKDLAELETLLHVVAGNLSSGICSEVAWVKAVDYVRKVREGERGISLDLWSLYQANRGRSMEALLCEMSSHSSIREFHEFGAMYQMGKEAGNYLEYLVRETASTIAASITMHKMILSEVKDRQMELVIMQAIPIAFFFYMEWMFPGYFADMYTSVRGIVSMSFLLVWYLFVSLWGYRAMHSVCGESHRLGSKIYQRATKNHYVKHPLRDGNRRKSLRGWTNFCMWISTSSERDALEKVYGRGRLLEILRSYYFQRVVFAGLVLTGGIVVLLQEQGLGNGQIGRMLIMLIVVICIWMAPRYDLHRNRKGRSKELEDEYPMMVYRLAVLLGSGMNLRLAWERIVHDYLEVREQSGCTIYLYEEMRITMEEIRCGMGESSSYLMFGGRCENEFCQRFSILIAQSMKEGNVAMQQSLLQESKRAFEYRLCEIRQRGKAAAMKLLMPMMGHLLLVILLLLIPALKQLS